MSLNNFVICGLHNNDVVPIKLDAFGKPTVTNADGNNDAVGTCRFKVVLVGLHRNNLISIKVDDDSKVIL